MLQVMFLLSDVIHSTCVSFHVKSKAKTSSILVIFMDKSRVNIDSWKYGIYSYGYIHGNILVNRMFNL